MKPPLYAQASLPTLACYAIVIGACAPHAPASVETQKKAADHAFDLQACYERSRSYESYAECADNVDKRYGVKK